MATTELAALDDVPYPWHGYTEYTCEYIERMYLLPEGTVDPADIDRLVDFISAATIGHPYIEGVVPNHISLVAHTIMVLFPNGPTDGLAIANLVYLLLDWCPASRAMVQRAIATASRRAPSRVWRR